MDVKMDKVEPNFTPRRVVISIESAEELLVLRRLASTNVSVPTAVFGDNGYHGGSDHKDRNYSILYDFLGKLHKEIREWRP